MRLHHLLVINMSFFWLLATTARAADVKNDPISDAVVQIEAVHRHPALVQPWMRMPTHSVSGSGFLIDRDHILTSAHVVEYATQLKVKTSGDNEKLNAVVEALAPEIDLALLRLTDEKTLPKAVPLSLDPKLPAIKQDVTVYGFPTGGSLSVTKGIVSRIEFVAYSDEVSGLSIQIDAAINQGNSGGPVVADGKVVGLVYGKFMEAEGSGIIVPVEEIQQFLADVKDGQYDGKPVSTELFQALENETLRKHLGLGQEVTGVLVARPAQNVADSPFHAGDIVTHIAGIPIANNGTIKLPNGLITGFTLQLNTVGLNAKVPVTVLRKGEKLELQWNCVNRSNMLVRPLNGGFPSYLICGPLVFTVATPDFLEAILAETPGLFNLLTLRGSPMIRRLNETTAFPGEQLVIVSCRFLEHPMTAGYRSPVFNTLATVNGTSIKNISHLAETILNSKERFLIFAFHDPLAEKLVFDRQEMLKSTDELLEQNGIRRAASDDLVKKWPIPLPTDD